MKISYLLSYKIIVVVLFSILSGCSHKNITISEINDPLENINRKIFNFKSDAEEYLEKIPSKPKVYFNPKIPKESYLELNTSYYFDISWI